jgi:anti-sigma regulatory factor (Ser/Thr protein kinase)
VYERPIELTFELPPDPAALASLRRAVRAWLERVEVGTDDAAAIVAACSEVAAEAIEVCPVDVRGGIAGSDVVVRFTGGPGWQIEDRPSRYVAALLVDDVSIERSPNETAVVLRKATSRGLS